MKERPILMSGPNIQPILEGRKTQTRRIIKLPHNNPLGEWEPTRIGGPNGGRTRDGNTIPEQDGIWHTRTGDSLMCPHGQPGDRLWVRETWFHQEGGPVYDAAGGLMDSFDDEIIYRADKPNRKTVKWKPSIFMPRWASRILLEITDIRVERLQEISEEDAKAEGISFGNITDQATGEIDRDAVEAYEELWESINGDGSWDKNPFVWVISFKRIEP